MNKKSNELQKNNIKQQQYKKQYKNTQKEKEKEFEDNLINDFNDLKTFIKLYRNEVLRNWKILNYSSIWVWVLNIILYLTILFK